jgi:hypothetical protein
MNDTQSMARQRGSNSGGSGSNQNFGPQRQGSYSGNSGGGGGDGYNNNGNMNQYDSPPSNNYNSYGGNGNSGNNYPMNNQMGGGGVKRENIKKWKMFNSRYSLGPMSVPFTMKIRGVPFEAGEKEVFEVRKRRYWFILPWRENIPNCRTPFNLILWLRAAAYESK